MSKKFSQKVLNIIKRPWINGNFLSTYPKSQHFFRSSVLIKRTPLFLRFLSPHSWIIPLGKMSQIHTAISHQYLRNSLRNALLLMIYLILSATCNRFLCTNFLFPRVSLLKTFLCTLSLFQRCRSKLLRRQILSHL